MARAARTTPGSAGRAKGAEVRSVRGMEDATFKMVGESVATGVARARGSAASAVGTAASVVGTAASPVGVAAHDAAEDAANDTANDTATEAAKPDLEGSGKRVMFSLSGQRVR